MLVQAVQKLMEKLRDRLRTLRATGISALRLDSNTRYLVVLAATSRVQHLRRVFGLL